ncbi:MAG: CDP-glycerol glycerophosphotransferase family protein [Clostridia bacterium]|nr:CDP-glycerol glycerophosphotransferase family protein [Clostridia bacterium]
MNMSYLASRFKKLSLMRWRDVKDLFIILAACPCGLVLRLFRRRLWIVSEMEHTARDNGYWFFKYMRENYPDRPVYYPIQFTSADYPRVAKLGNVIRHGSFRHHVYTWAAEMDISARTGRGLPAQFMCRQFQMIGLYPFKEVFLQHGVTKESPPFLLREHNRIDLFLATTEPEAKEICTGLHYSEDAVVVTGMARYDQLNTFTVNPKQILVMPTWRNWLYPPFGKSMADVSDEVKASNYVQTYCRLLANERLNRFLEEKDLNILFFPHSQMQPFLSAFTGENSRIHIASMEECDVQTALKESAYLVTDYSSIFFDFAYMKKPLSYFQFDYEEFRSRHYPEGYFSYTRDGFGPVVKTADELVDELIRSCESGFTMLPEYAARVDATFRYRDNENCRRTLEAIEALRKKGGRRK